MRDRLADLKSVSACCGISWTLFCTTWLSNFATSSHGHIYIFIWLIQGMGPDVDEEEVSVTIEPENGMQEFFAQVGVWRPDGLDKSAVHEEFLWCILHLHFKSIWTFQWPSTFTCLQSKAFSCFEIFNNISQNVGSIELSKCIGMVWVSR